MPARLICMKEELYFYILTVQVLNGISLRLHISYYLFFGEHISY